MLPRPKKTRTVYFDHAATTATDSAVVRAMLPYFTEKYGTPSSLYGKGRETNGALNDARRTVAKIIGALPDNIIFTGSGTESDNLAIFGVARAYAAQGKHIISTAVEHHAVLHALEDLKKQGWEITLLPVNAEGLVSAEAVMQAIRPDTVLISVMYANNEVGAIEPVAEIGRNYYSIVKRIILCCHFFTPMPVRPPVIWN